MLLSAIVPGPPVSLWLPREARAGLRPITHRIEMRNFAYRPAELSAARGDSVLWTNLDAFTHTVTAPDGEWDSGSIRPEWSWRMVADSTFSFRCRFHPSMRGTVTVP